MNNLIEEFPIHYKGYQLHKVYHIGIYLAKLIIQLQIDIYY